MIIIVYTVSNLPFEFPDIDGIFFLYRRLPGEESVIYVNFICVLIALNCVVIVCLYHWKTEVH